jgi:uncharacterized protein
VASGLIALLDDIAAIAKVAASSLDDVIAQSAKAGSKAAGIIIDDAAVTPRYVVGFASNRELPIVWKIARGSLINKILFLLPGALALSFLAPWLITPLLMIGGAYLCFEGYEKLHSLIVPKAKQDTGPVASSEQDAKALESERVSGAIRTDFILSAEIMAITLSTVSDASFAMQAAVLGAVGLGITIVVYGAVALIVKADDAGAAMALTGKPLIAPFGRGIVKAMPGILSTLSIVGTAAMLWVGGDIVLHGLAHYGISGPESWIKDTAKAIGGTLSAGSGIVTWLLGAFGAGIVGAAIGALVVPVVHYGIQPLIRTLRPAKA